MKRIFIFLVILLASSMLLSKQARGQSPQKMHYQAVIHNNSNILVTNQQIGMQISILQGSPAGIVVYMENQTPITNENGLVNLVIGNGTTVSGDFSAIDWATGPYFIKTETDISGGTDYSFVNSTQLLSVPYVLYIKTAESIADTTISIIKNTIYSELLDIGMNGVVKDSDGNAYKTIKIGNQVWMAENLRTTTYGDGTPIAKVTDNTAWSEVKTGVYCWYDNDSATYAHNYGALYNWYAVETNKICPAGWHVPDDIEWLTLADYLGGTDIAGGKLKETGTIHWNSPNAGATNESGFTALPGGNRSVDGTFYYIGINSQWWSSYEYSTGYAYTWRIYYNETNIFRSYNYKPFGFSIRCIKDE
jgi:uncharacterized protein (TIGR02145 family)